MVKMNKTEEMSVFQGEITCNGGERRGFDKLLRQRAKTKDRRKKKKKASNDSNR